MTDHNNTPPPPVHPNAEFRHDSAAFPTTATIPYYNNPSVYPGGEPSHEGVSHNYPIAEAASPYLGRGVYIRRVEEPRYTRRSGHERQSANNEQPQSSRYKDDRPVRAQRSSDGMYQSDSDSVSLISSLEDYETLWDKQYGRGGAGTPLAAVRGGATMKAGGAGGAAGGLHVLSMGSRPPASTSTSVPGYEGTGSYGIQGIPSPSSNVDTLQSRAQPLPSMGSVSGSSTAPGRDSDLRAEGRQEVEPKSSLDPVDQTQCERSHNAILDSKESDNTRQITDSKEESVAQAVKKPSLWRRWLKSICCWR